MRLPVLAVCALILMRSADSQVAEPDADHAHFSDTTAKSGVDFQGPTYHTSTKYLIETMGSGVGVFDYDNGRIDAVVSTNGGAAHILHNETQTQHHWLTLLLVGHRSNRDGIGATITLTTAHGMQYETVSTAGSYLSSNDKRVHFGLGDESSAKSIEIHWPSGIVQRLEGVRGDRILTIDEPATSPQPNVHKTPGTATPATTKPN